MNRSKTFGAALLVAAASLAPALRAETVGMGTVWYDDVALTGQNSGPSYGFWAPSGQASLTGFTFTPGANTTTNDGTAIASGQVFLQNLVMVNATTGTATTAFLTVVDTTNNTVVGASTNSVSLAPGSTQSAGTPWRFGSLGLDAGKRYAFIFTSTAGVAGTVLNAVGADGAPLAAADIDPGASTLTVVNYRIGGLTTNQAADRIAGSGVFGTGTTTAGFGNTEQWFSAGLTTTSQALQTLAGGAADATQSSAVTTSTGLRKTGTGTYTLTSTAGNSIAGDIFVEEGGLKVNTAASGNTASILGSGQVYLINANPAATAVTQNNATMNGTTLEVSTAAGNATLNTAVEGAGKLVKSGANTLTVTSTNSFSGNLQVLAGTLSVSSVSNIGTSSQIGRGNSSQDAITLVGATFLYTGAAGSTNRRFSIAPAGGTILNDGTGALQVTGSGNIGSNGIAAGTTVRTLTLGGTYNGDANVFGNNIVDYVAGTATNLIKSGAGIWALTGSNTYTGTTAINAGTLQVGNGGTGSLGTGAVTVSAGTNLKFNRTGTLAVAANIGGSGDIANDGNGEVSLTGSNTFTGNLSVNAGTVAFEGASSAGSLASVTIGASGRIAVGSGFVGGTLTLRNLSGSGLVNTLFNATAGTRTLAVQSVANTTFSGTLNEDTVGGRILALTKTGNGVLTLSGGGNFSGGTTLSAGTLHVTSGTALGTGAITASGGALSGAATLSNAVVLASNLTVSSDTALTLSGGISETGGVRVLSKSGSGTVTLGGASTYTGATNVLTGRLALAAGATLASPTLMLADGAELESADTFSLGSGKTLALGALGTIASASHFGSLALAGGTLGLDFSGTNHDSLTVSGDLSLASGTLAFTNTTTFETGVYNVLSYGGAYTAPAQASDLALSGLAAGGTSRQTFALTHDETAKVIQLTVAGSGQNVRWTGAVDGAWNVGGASTANWLVTDAGYAGDNPEQFFNGDVVSFGDGASTGAVVIGADDLTPVSVAFAADTLDYTVSSSGGAITGGSVSKSGAATLTLESAHTYAGGTALSAGRLRLGADGALGSGLLTITGGRLSAAGAASRTVANAVRFAADVSLGDDGADNGQLTFSGALGLDGASRTLTLLSDVVITGAVSGGSLTKAGAGKLTLTGANALAADLTVSAGTVALGASGAISDSVAVTLASGATLDLGGFSESLGSLVIGSGATATSGTITGGTVTITDGSTLSASLGGSASLVKNGAFSLTLGSAVSRTGSTTVNNGTLLIGDAGALGSGALALNGGALAMSDATDRTLANNVTLGGNVTLGAAGAGKLTFSGTVGLGGANRTLTLANDIRLNGVVSNGSLTKAGNGTLTLAGSGTYTGGTTIVSGAVVATAGNALGTSGTVTLNGAATGGASTSLGIDATAGSVTLARAIVVANEGSGVTTIGSTAFANTTQQAIFSGAITLAKGVTLHGAGGDRTQFSGGISGTGDVRVTSADGARVLFLTNANTFSGNLTVAANSRLQLSDGSTTAASLIPDAAIVTLEAGANLRFAKGGNAATEVVGGFRGTGTVTAVSGADKLEINHADTQTMSVSLAESGGTLALTKSGAGSLTFDGAYGITGGLTVTAGTLTFANAVNLAGNTTVRGRLVLSGNTLLGNNLVNSGTNTDAEVDFGANTVTIGTASAGEAYYGKLTGTGSIVLAGGTGSIANIADGTVAGNVTGNRQVWVQTATGVIQDTSVQFFALSTGVSAGSRRDFIFANDTGEALVLSALSGFGSIRGDWGGTNGQTVTRRFIVDQDTDTVFNGAFLSHRSGGGALRALSLTKRGSGRLEMAGFVGKQTASAQAGVAGVHLAVEEGELDVTNAANTTTSNTGAIDLATVTVTGGTLGFAAQSLVNTAGTAGASSILLDGGTLRWNAGNTQDVSLGGRLQLVAGKDARLDVGANDVTLSAAFGGASGGSLTKLGNGTLTLSAANTFTGGTTLAAGKLVAGNASAFGSGDILLSAGILDFNNLDVLNRVIFAGGTLINVRSGGAVAVGGSLTAEQINALDIPAIAATAGTTLDLAGVTKDVVVTGSATLAGLAGFSGNLRVTAGVLDLSDPDNRPVRGVGGSFPGTVEVGGGGGADFGTVAFDGPIIYKGGTITGAFTGNLNVAGTGVALTAGAISGGKVVVATDNSVAIGAGFAGTVRLEGGSVTSGIDTFAGNLELGTGGSLNLTTDLAPSAAVVVDDGGVLRGTGTVASLTVASGGLLTPGNSPGMTTVTGNLVLQGGGALDLEILATGGEIFDPVAGADYDSVTIGGDLDLTGLSLQNRFLINVISLLDPSNEGQVADFDPALTKVYDVYTYGGQLLKTYAGSATELFQLDTSAFTFEGAALDPLVFTLVHNTAENKIQLVYAPIPEPSTYGLILGGLALAGAAIRRRKKAAK